MERTRHTQARSLLDALLPLRGDGLKLGCIVDPTRHGGPAETARALELAPEDFERLPNLHDAFAPAHRADGPRWIDPDESQLSRLAELAVARQGVHFLATSAPLSAVPAHLRSLVKLEQHDGSKLLFRWQDSFVLAALAPLLSDAQGRAFLGPVEQWLSLDACRNEVRLERPPGSTVPAPVRLEPAQLERLSRAMLPFTVIGQADEVDSTLLGGLDECARLGRIEPLLKRAERHGLDEEEDLSLYAVLALQLPPDFDQSGPVARALERARSGEVGFGEAIDQVPIEEWRAWDEDLEQRGD